MTPSPQDELFDLLAKLVGTLSPEDLAEDDELRAMIGQLISILEPKAVPLPLDITEKLMALDSGISRFKRAAELVQATNPAQLKALAESLRQAGLLK